MGDIVNLTDFKNVKASEKPIPTTQELFDHCLEGAIPDWEASFFKNQTGDLLSTESGIKISDHRDFAQLKTFETEIGLGPIVFAPGTMMKRANFSGWVAGFSMNGNSFATPEMTTEQDARAFNALMYLRLKNILKV